MNNQTIVIMCLYKRHSNLPLILLSLNEQTYKNFKYIIWDNSEDKQQTKNIIQTYKKNLDLDLIESAENVGGIGRFYAASEFCNQYKIMIFFDDDQIPKSSFVETMVKAYEPKTIKAKRSFKILKDTDYWIRQRAAFSSSDVNYCSTCGMVLDSEIFKYKDVLDCPKEYIFIEDLWLSYYAQHILKWKLISIKVPIKIIKDNKNQYHYLFDKKNKFLQFLTQEKKWNLNITY
jgi:glycosyltransferase involved in cell wall biosynthesis